MKKLLLVAILNVSFSMFSMDQQIKPHYTQEFKEKVTKAFNSIELSEIMSASQIVVNYHNDQHCRYYGNNVKNLTFFIDKEYSSEWYHQKPVFQASKNRSFEQDRSDIEIVLKKPSSQLPLNNVSVNSKDLVSPKHQKKEGCIIC